MSRLHCPGSIAGVAFAVALLSPQLAGAQEQDYKLPLQEPGGLVNNSITGVQYDLWNQKKAGQRLDYRQEKLRRDTESGDREAVEHDNRRIDFLRYRMAVNCWLIRKNTNLDPGYYPVRTDPYSLAALAQVATPAPFMNEVQFAPASASVSTPTSTGTTTPTQPSAPRSAAATIPITIVNTSAPGPGIAFAIDGIAHESPGGSRQDYTITADSYITYASGGSMGAHRYRLSQGVYEFRSSAGGWALYKQPDNP